jgi:hypothetical protein
VIVALFPELSSAGGVQRAGRLTASALSSYASRHGEKCTLFSLNDPPNLSTVHIGSQEIQVTGFGRSKTRFAAAAWRIASLQPHLVVALHPNLAPIVAAMRFRSPQTRSVVFAHGVEVPLHFDTGLCLMPKTSRPSTCRSSQKPTTVSPGQPCRQARRGVLFRPHPYPRPSSRPPSVAATAATSCCPRWASRAMSPTSWTRSS